MLQRWSIAIVRCRQGVRWRALCCALGLLLLSAGQMHARDGVAQEQPPFAPPTPARFERLGLEDGLSQNAVLAMLQDRHGFLWFGTQDGLNRYDGYTFVVYKNDPDDSNSLSLNSVLALHEDDDGTLWIGTWGGGLNHFDPQSNLWLRYRHDDADATSLCGDTVTALLDDGAGTLWVGTNEGGLCAFDRETRTFTPYRHDPADPASIAANAVSTLALDKDGALWVGTGGFGIPGAGLDRLDRSSGIFTHFRHDVLDAESLSSNTISAVLPDSDGTLWVGTGGFSLTGAGLNHLDPATGRAVRYRHNPAEPASLASDDIIDLYRDSAGDLWIGTWGGGVDRLPKQEGTASFVHHRHDAYRPTSLSADIVWSMLEDRSGVFWFGTINGGISKINPQVQRFGLYRNHPENEHSLGFDVVGAFHEDRAGGIWIGLWGGGLDYFDRATGEFTHYRSDPVIEGGLTNDTISAIFEDEAGNIWIGSFDGLFKLDRTTGAFTHFTNDPTEPNSLVNDSVYRIASAGDGRLWLGTLGGLDLFDPAAGTFTHFLHDDADPASLPDNQVTALYHARDGRLWLGTWHGGLAYLDPAAWADGEVRFVSYQHDPDDPSSLSDNSVWAIHEDHTGGLWVGTQVGLNRLDGGGRTFTRYREKEGLPNNAVLCIEEDQRGYLWIATNNGLAHFNTVLPSFRSFDERDGLQSNEFNSGACLRSRNGELYFGGVHGFNVFQPDDIQRNPAPPPVVITSFSIFNQPAPVDLTGKTPIDLTYDESFIAFEFAALDYHAPQKNRYAYKLEGFDEGWVDAGSRRYAGYTNLPGGEYLFRVRGSNNDGTWNEAGVAIPLRVTPPVWQTGWFRGGAVFMMMMLLVGGIGWRINNIRVQNRRLERTVAEQTAELRREIEQRQQAEAALAQKAAEEAVAAERTRLARDLHDAVTQTLFSASLTAEVLPELWEADPADGRATTEELRQLTRGALAEMRTLLLELRPGAVTQARLDDLIRQLIEASVGRGHTTVHFVADGQRPLPDDVKVALYRIAQEALNNIVKYAKANTVSVDLRQQPMGVRLSISDDGVGFDPAAVRSGHMGQRIMRERAESIGARFAVQSEIGHGTIVMVTWNDPDWQESEGEEA
ncbi:MAG: GGDEF domain-containing protein [Caldilineaceae bacterium]|nr:GGDEF domain-containing protein [Caldilineaceae bacterium]